MHACICGSVLTQSQVKRAIEGSITGICHVACACDVGHGSCFSMTDGIRRFSQGFDGRRQVRRCSWLLFPAGLIFSSRAADNNIDMAPILLGLALASLLAQTTALPTQQAFDVPQRIDPLKRP